MPELREDAPTWHVIAPDADKLIRCVADALTVAGVWADDSQMALMRGEKVYAEAHSTLIEIWSMA